MNLKYPDELVALVRAACHAKLGHKVIARCSGVSLCVVEKISQGLRAPEIPPHPEFRRRMEELFKVSKLPDDNEGLKG